MPGALDNFTCVLQPPNTRKKLDLGWLHAILHYLLINFFSMRSHLYDFHKNYQIAATS